MLFRTPFDSDVKSTQQLVIFCYAEERVLLPLPSSYEDALQLARDEFSLAGDLVFETDDLLGADKPYVRIHRAAWIGISAVLRCVYIRKAQASPVPVGRPRTSDTLNTGSRRLSSQKRISVVGSTPLRSAAPPVERQSLSARKAPISAPPSRPSSIISVHHEAGPSSTKGSPPYSKSPVPSFPITAKIEELEDDEDIRVPSPTKKRSARPRVLSDYGMDNADDADKSVNVEDSDEEFDQLDMEESDITSTGPPKSKASATLSRSGSGSLVELDGPPSAAVRSAARQPERRSPVRQLEVPSTSLQQPKINVEKAKPQRKPSPEPSQPSQLSQSQSQSRPQPSKSDESFLISIEYSDDPESRTLFKTRGRHAVSKVLMQACRTFELEEYFRSARLILLIEEEDEDGELVYQRRYVCDRNETMAEAGAEPNAKFVVEVVEENDEDDD